ncbi:MAG TPA: hypothetical protein DD435_15855 [Cyanobacteria bacterium UBA8530]|nr:hypothetical protein [Cyanobacteria bacterium UBA8530]
MIRREVFDAIGYYDGEFKVFGDREFVLRFAKAGLQAKGISRIIGLYLDSRESLGHSEPARAGEWNELFLRYLKPENFIALFGLKEIPDSITLSRVYAVTGSLGYGFHNQASNFTIAARLFEQALLHDPDNFAALNGRGVIHCLCGEFEEAIALFGRAIEMDSKSAFLADNLMAAKRSSFEVAD